MFKKELFFVTITTIHASLTAFIKQENLYKKPLSARSYKELSNTYCLIAQETKNALADWCLHLLESFDPHVGDQACHIGTTHILSLMENLSEQLVQKSAAQCIKACKKMTHLSAPIPYKNQTFESFLENNGLSSLMFSDDIEFLSCSHFVTTYYSSNKKEQKEKGKKLARLYNISPATALSLITQARQKLNAYNCSFILKLAEQTEGKEGAVTCGLQHIHEHKDIKTRSAYCAFKTIYDHLCRNQIPVLLTISVVCTDHGTIPQIHQLTAAYRSPSAHAALRWCDPLDLNACTPCYVSQAWAHVSPENIQITEWEKKIKCMHPSPSTRSCHTYTQVKEFSKIMDFKELWLCQAASHPQFSGNFELNFKAMHPAGSILKEEFESYKSKDISRLKTHNPALFLIHDYPSCVGLVNQ